MKKFILKSIYLLLFFMVGFVAYGFSSDPDISGWREGWEELNG